MAYSLGSLLHPIWISERQHTQPVGFELIANGYVRLFPAQLNEHTLYAEHFD